MEIIMWKTKLCIALSKQFGISYEEQMRLLKQIGFDGFFVEWSSETDVAGLRKLAEELGLMFQSIHAPYTKSHLMWTENAEEATEELLACLNDCAKNDVPIMVCHAFIGFKDHTPTEVGVRNYGRLVDEAEKLGVKIAFENTEGEEYFACLMDAFRDRECVGFCWDTGHEMCYNHSKDMMAVYGDRLMCTHLNDNLGIRDFDGEITYIDDLHLLPFDGIADWTEIARRLNKYGFCDCLTFELNTLSKPGRKENDVYSTMAIEEYLTEAYKRACRVAALKEKDMKRLL